MHYPQRPIASPRPSASARAWALSCIIAVGVVATLQGCAPAIVATGAATGAVVAHDRRTTGTVVEDNAIVLKIARLVSDDRELDSQTHVNVNSYNAVVLLTGEAPTPLMRAQAEKYARQVEKVRNVYNEIIVAAPSSLLTRTSDTLLLAKIKGNMVATKGVDPTRIKVIVEQGTVYLMGLVTDIEARTATEVVRRIDGVQKVVRLFEYIDADKKSSRDRRGSRA